MFGALVPNQEIDLGTESYEEVVDNFCTALEDVEGELSSLEAMSESIDNAEAFASAIESCGATPALMQFGYACDDSFEQLIGRAAPSDFATEDMAEFGSFALESVKSKLKLAWEAVKDFIIRLWEKLKEFGRWLLRLFDRKIARLKEIAKKKPSKNEFSKEFNDRVFKNAMTKSSLTGMINDLEKCIEAPTDVYVTAKNVGVGGSINEPYKSFIIGAGYSISKDGSKIEQTLKVARTNKKGSELGFTGKQEIISLAGKLYPVLEKRNEWEKQIKKMDKIKAETEAAAKKIEIANLPDDEKPEKKDDDERRAEIKAKRQKAIATSRMIVTMGKISNNAAALVIQYASAAGL
jgi:hypothetical protein